MQLLQDLPLFRSLSPGRLSLLCSASAFQEYEKGQVLFHQDERTTALWVVLEGRVQLLRGDHSRAVLIFTITPQEALCGISAIDSACYTVDAVAGTFCRVVRIPWPLFQETLLHEPAFAYQTLQLCVRRIRHIAQQYGSMAEPVSHRLIRTILRLREQFGATLPVTHRELAQMSWTTTESAIRCVRQLKQKGCVSGSRGRLIVSDPAGLEACLMQRGHQTNGATPRPQLREQATKSHDRQPHRS